MTIKELEGLRPGLAARLGLCALWLSILGGCVSQQPEPVVLDNLADMQIRIRLLQTELAALRTSLAEEQAQQAHESTDNVVLEQRIEELQARIAALPGELTDLCPDPPQSATVTTQCEASPEAARVIVSGDKLVVGLVERVWIDPPGAFLDARIDANADSSALHATEVVEFERDGNKWVRFDLPLAEEAVTVERRLKRYVRNNGEGARRPAVELRVQLGDVRERVELTLVELDEPAEQLVLGRNFLTDVALVDVSRRNVQPAFNAPQ